MRRVLQWSVSAVAAPRSLLRSRHPLSRVSTAAQSRPLHCSSSRSLSSTTHAAASAFVEPTDVPSPGALSGLPPPLKAGQSVGEAAREEKVIAPEPETQTSRPAPKTERKAQAAAPSPYLITADHVKRAFKRINQTVLRTPCDYSPRLSPIIGSSLYLKKEHLSITGSYKERGALNKLLQLTPDERARGVICSSAGNHAQAVSYHSTRLGIDGVIVMPINAPHTKVKSTREFGARVVQAGESFSEAYEHAVKLAKDEGRTFIHAFNDPEVVAGQGTVAMELLEQNPYMDAVVVPVGGGGLIAGMALLLKAVNPRVKIYGVESSAMPGMHASVRAGKLQSVKKRPTMADGIAIEHVGAIAFDIIRDCVDEIVLVDEDEVAQAVLLMLEKEKTVTEGSGAAGLAALLAGKLPQVKDQNVVCVVTGSNIDMSLLSRIIEKGLVMTGRMARVHVTVLDVPGQLAKVLAILRDLRANVKDIEHERAFLLGNVGTTQPIITIETRDFEHIKEVVDTLKKEGFEDAYLATPVA